MRSDISRRSFLRTAAGAGVAAGASGAVRAQATTTVDMTDELVFDPDAITVAPGDTVVWENVGEVGHSVTAYEEGIPDDAEYFASGDFSSESAARSGYASGDPDSGFIGGGGSYEHTFEVEGTYEYFCIPHETIGMVGTVEVVEGGPPADGGPSEPALPDVAKTLGIAVGTAMMSVLGLTYLFMRYGGDYSEIEGSADSKTD